MHIDCAYRWDFGVPSESQQCGFSEVRSLTLTHGGAPGEDLGHVLSWMKDPLALHIEVGIDYARFYPFAREAGEITMAGLLSALEPLKEKLQEIFLRVDYYGEKTDYHLRGTAFREFSALKRLNVPLEALVRLNGARSLLDPIVSPPLS